MICSKCSQIYQAQEPRSINVGQEPEKKASVMDGSIFVSTCPYCGTANLCSEPVLYHDPDQHILIAFTSAALNSDTLEGYTCRRVSSIGALIEKVKIFEAGLDDIAVELAKFVTLQELGKQVELKFFKMDGPDGEITLTYPEKGQMQMLAIGYNVYSDCVGIMQRNPVLKEQAQGLACIDQEWLSRFVK